ncbi:MAG: rhodanese-related sulfurtransferase [Pseudomonadales bacterium]
MSAPSVMTFYRFAALTDLEALRTHVHQAATALNLRGTVLLAEEGINGTLCGAREALEALRSELLRDARLAGMPFKFSTANADNPVFHRLKVRIKPEIVSFGQPHLRPGERTGEHVDAARWNALLEDPEVVVIDTRNRYEVAIGTFPGALDPGTRTFREFPEFVRSALDPQRNRRVAMFCTGGIRCEKASAFLLEQGFAAVYQLDGGILRYLETVDPADNRWQGDCFVFDQRVSVTTALAEGAHSQCYACRRALTAADRASAQFQEGISCPHCFEEVDAERRRRFAERRRQVLLAEARGARHIGAGEAAGQRRSGSR